LKGKVSRISRSRRRRDADERRRQHEVDAGRGLGQALAVLLPPLERALELAVGDRKAALDLRAHVGAVRVGVLEEELAVHVCDLAVKGLVEPFGQRQVEPPAPREALGSRLDACCHERIGELRPRDSDLDLLECHLCRREARSEHIHHPLARGDVPRHRPRVVVARGEREAAIERHQPPARLEADDAAAGGGDADRAAGVGAERRVREPCRQRRRGAAARAARKPPRSQRIRNRPEMLVLRGRAVRELVQVRLAGVRVSRRLQPPHGLRGLARHVLGEQDRAVGRDEPGRVEEVLDRERNPLAGLLRAGEEDPLEVAQESAR
jgi:hypothetical protein